jgi:asparagine N-glycosylation enzyme membrane subunit Stt3
MGLIWGGYQYIPLVLAGSIGVAFILGQIDKNKIIVFGIWTLISFSLLISLSLKYTLRKLINAPVISFSFLILIIIVTHQIIFKTNLHKKIYRSYFKKIPKEIFSGGVISILMIVGSALVFGVDFISSKLDRLISALVNPATSRLIQTVAENRQPYFGEWSNAFDPIIYGIPVFFWLFFIGSVYVFYKMVSSFKLKERMIMTGSYLFFLIAIIFSRYSPSSVFNGENDASLIFYALGFIVLIGVNGYYYVKCYFNEERKYKLLKINFGLVFLLAFFVLGVISARGAVRLIMMLVPPISIVVSYFVVSLINDMRNADGENKKKILKVLVIIIAVLTIFSGGAYYYILINLSAGYIPEDYEQQWQKAMSWVRDNTPENAVFGHWWDYGYWVQSIGERTTILDGGNAVSYWNHLMGRHVLTSPNDKTALEFLYAHNTTHYLIDSTDVWKYISYSAIGSNIEYDRQNVILEFSGDNGNIQEFPGGLIHSYFMEIYLNEDIFWENNGTNYYFPKENSGIGTILIIDINGSLEQPQAVFVKGTSEQVTVPLKYLYANGELKEFENGIEAGVILFDTLLEENGRVGRVPNSAGFYLSNRTINSFIVRKYFFGEEGNFKLVHSEPNYIAEVVRSKGHEIGEFVHYQGEFYGPIKIWEIEYPEDIEFKEEYLETKYPEELRLA